MESINRESTNGRDTLDAFFDGQNGSEKLVLQLQTELRHCQQVIASLSNNSGDAGQKLIDLASENSKLRDELDTALKSKETSEAKSQEQLQARKDEIDDLRAQLLGLESERIRYFNKCQELEQQLHEDESRFYRDLNGRPTVDTTGQDRVQHRIVQEARDSSQVNSLFNQLDATTSILCHSQVAADTLSKHAKNMDIYQSNIVAMYEQLKHTAKFLADIVHSLGLDNSQIELLMQKISQLQLDMSETHEMSRRIATETRQVANEMSALSAFLEDSIQQTSMLQTSVNPSILAPENTGISKAAFDEVIAKNTELVQKEMALKKEVAEVQHQLGEVIAKNTELAQNEMKLKKEAAEVQHQLSELRADHEKLDAQLAKMNKSKRELIEKYTDAVKMVEKRDEELKNREDIIEKLRGVTNVINVPPKLPEGLEKDIENQLEHIYTTLSAVNTNLQKKH